MIVDGIEVSITRERLDDFEVFEAIADAGDESATDAARLAASVRLLRLALGRDYARVKRELRAKNGGLLTTEDMNGFFTRCLEAVNAKN